MFSDNLQKYIIFLQSFDLLYHIYLRTYFKNRFSEICFWQPSYLFIEIKNKLIFNSFHKKRYFVTWFTYIFTFHHIFFKHIQIREFKFKFSWKQLIFRSIKGNNLLTIYSRLYHQNKTISLWIKAHYKSLKSRRHV